MSTPPNSTILRRLLLEAIEIDEELPHDAPARIMIRRVIKTSLELVAEIIIDELLPRFADPPENGPAVG